MTVINLTSNGLRFLLLLAGLAFIPILGFAQDSEKNDDVAGDAGDAAAQSNVSEQPKTEIKVSPNRCVTLRQGQPCFVRVRFNWQSSEVVKACLYGVEGKELKCWQASSEGNAYIAQTLPNTTEYVLINDEGVELSRDSVSVAWVYKKKRSKRRWRLF